MPYIPGWGNPDAKLVIIAANAGPAESKALMTNRELYKMLLEIGINPNDLWLTTVVKDFVPPSPRGKKIPFHIRCKNAGINLEQSQNALRTEIQQINPNAILALGNTALNATTGKSGIGDYRGSIIFGLGCKVVSTFNPADLSSFLDVEFVGYYTKGIIRADFKRAWEQAQFKDYNPPTRRLEIIKSSWQLEGFLSHNEGKTRPSVDIEARGQCLPACVGIAFTPKWGVTIPLWNHGEYKTVTPATDTDMVRQWTILAKALDKHYIVGQNFKYDHDKLLRLGFRTKLGSDLMLKMFSINAEGPKSLAYMTSMLTEEPFYKNEGMYEGSLSDLLIGCARDACVQKEIDIKLDEYIDEVGSRDYYENFILHLHDLYLGVESEGMFVNSETRERLFRKYIAKSEELQYELRCIVGERININSPTQVSLLLYEVFKLPRRQGTGEEIITELLNLKTFKDPAQRRACEIILEARKVEKTISTYLGALPDFDGKMKTTYFLCLDTGRTSTGQLDPPIRPTIDIESEGVFTGKRSKKHKNIGTAFQTITKHGDIGSDVREQYEPAKGHLFVQGDSAQAETRVVFLLADDEDALKDIDTRDYHAWTASWFFGGTEQSYSKRTLGFEHPIRFVGKTLRHACHLGASFKRAATTVNTDARKYGIDIKIEDSFAKKAIAIFHAKQPKIQEVFHNGVVEALSSRRQVLHSAVPFGINSKVGGRRQFFERWGDELFRQAFSYIPQRSVSDNTKAAALRIRRKHRRLARLILEAHDGLMYMIPENEVDYFAAILKEEMERPIRFDTCSIPRHDLVIPCEIEVGVNYLNFEKYKRKS